jgi:very-short-patch-repair endonuclease
MLAVTHPHLRDEFLYCIDKNGNKDEAKTFNTLNSHSAYYAIWKCSEINCNKNCEHIYKSRIAEKTGKNPSKCPFCSRKRFCLCNSFLMKQPKLSMEWGTNNLLKPSDVSEKSGKLIEWICLKSNCGHHIWKTSPNHRVLKKTGCPYCAKQKICICDSLFMKHPELAKEWGDDNILQPTEIAEKSNHLIQWKCLKSKCSHHVWMSTPNDRVSKQRGCPYCVGQKTCECYCLASEFPDLLNDEWDENKNDSEGLDIFKLSPYSNRHAWWICKICKHSWKSSISNRTKGGRDCSICCQSKMEKSMLSVLTILKTKNMIHFFKSQWRLTNTKMYADFFIISHDEKIMIEMDGIQHFSPQSFGTKHRKKEDMFLEIQQNDKHKKEWCENNHIRLLRISYLVKPIDYEIELIEFINNKNVTFRLVGKPQK